MRGMRIDGLIPVEVDETNGDAKLALDKGEIDALVADLPTAFAVASELSDGQMVGQLPTAPGDVEQFGIVLAKDSPLTQCVSWAVEQLRADGTLDRAAMADRCRQGADADLTRSRSRGQRRARLHGPLPGVGINARRWPGRRTRGGGDAVFGQARGQVAMLRRRHRRRRLLWRCGIRRTSCRHQCRSDHHGQSNGPHYPTNLVNRADRCGTRPPSASTRSST